MRQVLDKELANAVYQVTTKFILVTISTSSTLKSVIANSTSITAIIAAAAIATAKYCLNNIDLSSYWCFKVSDQWILEDVYMLFYDCVLVMKIFFCYTSPTRAQL